MEQEILFSCPRTRKQMKAWAGYLSRALPAKITLETVMVDVYNGLTGRGGKNNALRGNISCGGVSVDYTCIAKRPNEKSTGIRLHTRQSSQDMDGIINAIITHTQAYEGN
ncbi:MAG: hypothetical protein AABW64_01130 [Nanoarchaeota archaeon]